MLYIVNTLIQFMLNFPCLHCIYVCNILVTKNDLVILLLIIISCILEYNKINSILSKVLT